MAVITCDINLEDPALNLDQQAPIVQCEHNVTRINFTRTIYEQESSQPTITLIFRSARGEEFTYTPIDYTVVERTSVIETVSEDTTEESPIEETETGSSEETEPSEETETGSSEETSEETPASEPVTITYWEETYSFLIPRPITEYDGIVSMSVCYIWRDTITVDGIERTIIAKEWNSLTTTFVVKATLHVYGVINQLDPTYVLEYDETGKIVYLTTDQT